MSRISQFVRHVSAWIIFVISMKRRLAAFAAISVIGFAAAGCQQEAADPNLADDARVQKLLDKGFKILVQPGDLSTAKAYYARIGSAIGFDPEQSDLNTLIAHFGYTGISANELETLDSKTLMTREPSLIASRFFAPKIVNFNSPHVVAAGADPFTPGWRKLVVLSPKSGSKAEQAGLASAYILFNFFQPNPEADPFAGESGNNQVILIPKTFTPQKGDAAYWLDYDTKSNNYKIAYALNAAFDVPEEGGSTTRDYFVPTACAQCHGHDEEYGGTVNGFFPFAKLNYLDTDQWYDMLGFDFPGTAAGKYDVLVDGGKDHGTADYKAAMAVLRRLNTAMLAQNQASRRPDGLDTFKILSAQKWLDLHAGQDQPQPPSRRALQVGTGAVWNVANSDEQALLQRLDRYCFRCHGSMYYTVFDKSAVLDKKSGLIRRIKDGRMPQGRTLSNTERTELIDLLNRVQ